MRFWGNTGLVFAEQNYINLFWGDQDYLSNRRKTLVKRKIW